MCTEDSFQRAARMTTAEGTECNDCLLLFSEVKRITEQHKSTAHVSVRDYVISTRQMQDTWRNVGENGMFCCDERSRCCTAYQMFSRLQRAHVEDC